MLATTAVQLVAVSPAHAGITGLIVVSQSTSAGTPKTSASISVACPGFKKVVAGGATVSFERGSTAYGHVAINASYPEANTWKALAVEDSTMPLGDWYLTSHAICVDNPAGLEVVKTSSAMGVHNGGIGVFANCPVGKKVLGFGAQVDMPSLDGSVTLHQFNPTSALGTVEAWASGAGTSVQWQLSSYAVCVNPVPQQVRVIEATGYTPNPKNVVAQCPAGTTTFGVGGVIGELALGDPVTVNATAFTYLRTGDAFPLVMVADYGAGTSYPWQARVVAVCAEAM
ncbi:MAG TPA: hypothetical protein DGG94_03800 [Micromonosporaceae bacterium]|nr:hypothetical protein [Micromonosporaceae bacterium]HCU48924.1 hypothetical protein [Micromonosporaceae bacterium]